MGLNESEIGKKEIPAVLGPSSQNTKSAAGSSSTSAGYSADSGNDSFIGSEDWTRNSCEVFCVIKIDLYAVILFLRSGYACDIRVRNACQRIDTEECRCFLVVSLYVFSVRKLNLSNLIICLRRVDAEGRTNGVTRDSHALSYDSYIGLVRVTNGCCDVNSIRNVDVWPLASLAR